MRNVSPELLALLGTRQFWTADLYTFSLIGGGVLRYCTGDFDVTWNGDDYSCGLKQNGPFFYKDGDRLQAGWKTGLEVNQLTFDVLPGDATVDGTKFLTAIRNGVFDGADVLVERAYAPEPGDDVTGTIILFNGRMVEITPAGQSLLTFNLNSYTELFDLGWPRNTYQAGCLNTLGDSACGIDLESLAIAGTVAAGTNATTVRAVLTQATKWFSLGKIKMTSGANIGVSRSVRAYTQASPRSVITLLTPFSSVPVVGDTFLIYPGCDKAFATCFGKFANLDNFRATPFVPENSTAV